MANVVFLDFDGVVNIKLYDPMTRKFRYNSPCDGKVNYEDAVKRLSIQCEQNDLSIVVISSWRCCDKYKSFLYKAGLSIKVKVDRISYSDENISRSNRIDQYLNEHPDIENYIIINGDSTFTDEQKNHLIQCNSDFGFTIPDEQKMVEMIENFNKTKLPYTRVSEEANKDISDIMDKYDEFLCFAESLGYNVKLFSDSEHSLELYYHDDYPNTILVDKQLSI